MAGLASFDWPGYLSSLPDGEAYALAIWLAAEGLGAGEFMEIVDRAYAEAPDHWQGRSRAFLAQVGRPEAEAFARRKRRFGALMATLEQALISGALPGEIAPQELALPALPRTDQRPAAELLDALERARCGQE
jgi:hypothetical protein